MALAATVAFAAVLLYHKPAGAIPRHLLRAVHLWTGERTVGKGASAEPSIVRRMRSFFGDAPSDRPVGASDVNPLAPPGRTGGSGTTWGGMGQGIGSGSGGPSGADASSPVDAGQGTATASGGVAGAVFLPGDGPANPAESQRDKVAAGLTAGASGGVQVDQVLPSSVAGKLGLRPGDIIVAINGSPVDTPQQFANLFEQNGLPRQIDAVRDGRSIHLHP